MQTTTDNIRERLMATNEEFSRLAQQHSYYERQLEQLAGRPYLTDAEQLEEITLKKKKLSLKDQMEQIVRQYRSQSSPAT